MPRSSDRRGLSGGRALYRSKQDSYASQGFEDDTRQSQLGGMVVAYLGANQSLPINTDTPLIFSVSQVNSLYTNLFMRGFMLAGDGTGFFVRKGGTYRASFQVFYNLLGAAQQTGSSILSITRGVDALKLRARFTNTDALNTGVFETAYTGIVDLLPGDFVQLTANPGAVICNAEGITTASNARGGTDFIVNSGLVLQEIDLPAPLT